MRVDPPVPRGTWSARSVVLAARWSGGPLCRPDHACSATLDECGRMPAATLLPNSRTSRRVGHVPLRSSRHMCMMFVI